ncbi:hypothetical protein F5050DRAFT_739164 [Lentinula boryana]|uniref:Secreted protein n=1 Tax=Lentinula boryana TaxID=40481 RepID=A0ABQ8Q3L9_9AGAR|nr:hypothetical protein F5050DRAFT_739164 [Lentinula boryana]
MSSRVLHLRFLARSQANTDRVADSPFDLSEPAYAYLLFINCCNFSKTRCDRLMSECRIRCCKKLLPSCFAHRVLTNDPYHQQSNK